MYQASVPVFRHYLSRVSDIVAVAGPDALDAQTPDIGYMPGHLTWAFGEQLTAMGVEIVNTDITGMVLRDRDLLTGDSPLAGNALGRLAATEVLADLRAR